MRDPIGLYEIEPIPEELGGESAGPVDDPLAAPDQTEPIPPEPNFE